MKFSLQLIVYLIINFGALGLGALFMGNAVAGDWYNELNRAPWTPPGWVFGAAWTVVMVTFSIFMARLTEKKAFWNFNRPIVILFWLQFVLNIAWNYLFFNQKLIGWGLVEIILLYVVVIALFLVGLRNKGPKAFWMSPYILWLTIAISLNGYIYFMN